MKKDASNVEDMNIPQITECLSLSCIASFKDWSSIFRTRSLTLCKMDFNDKSDSVTVLVHKIVINNRSFRVLCEQNVWLFINKSSRSYLYLEKTNSYQHSTLSTLMSKRPVRRYCSVHELNGKWLSYLVFPWLSDAVETSTSRVLLPASRDQSHHWSWLCCDSFFTFFFLRSSRLHFRTLQNWNGNILKKWFHSSRVKFPSVSMSASWFFVSRYLIRIWWS